MAEFYLKYQDNLPILRSELTDDNGYIDLSSASDIKFVYQLKSRIYPPVTGSASIIAPLSGLVEYSWPVGTTISGGTYYGEWITTFTGGRQLTSPNDGFILFFVQNRLF